MSSINTTGLGLEHGDIIEDNGTLFKVIRIGRKSTVTGTVTTRFTPVGGKAFWDEEAVETRIGGGQ